jgi:DNA repair exonuclease SbcCD ATPase subunit
MIIMIDQDGILGNAHGILLKKSPLEATASANEDGDFSLGTYVKKGVRKFLEKDNTPVTRLTLIAHSGFDKEGFQYFGGFLAKEFAYKLIDKLKEAEQNQKGYIQNLTSIDLIGCTVGCVFPNGECYAAKVAQILLKNGYNIPLKAFTNRVLPQPKSIVSMRITAEENEISLRGFPNSTMEKEYSEYIDQIEEIDGEKDVELENLAEEDEKLHRAEEELENYIKTISQTYAEKKSQYDASITLINKEYQETIAKKDDLKNQYNTALNKLNQTSQSLQEKISEAEGELINLDKKLSTEEIEAMVKSISETAKQANSKWKGEAAVLNEKVDKIITTPGTSETEKVKAIMDSIERTVKAIRSHFFSGRRSTTANAFQDVVDDKENVKSFNSLKSIITTIHKDALANNSKWKKTTKKLIDSMAEIDSKTASEKDKLTKALEKIDNASKDIRSHFFGGKGSTTATRLERILAKQDHYFDYAEKRDNISTLKARLEETKNKINQLNERTMQKANSLQQKIDSLKDTATKKKVELDQFKREAGDTKDAKETKVSSLKKNVAQLEGKINTLTEKMAVLERKKLTCIKEIVRTNDIRGELDKHPACNFTAQIKLRPAQAAKRVGFFAAPGQSSATAPTSTATPTPGTRGQQPA